MKSDVLHLLNDPEGCSSKNSAPHEVVRNPEKEEQGRNRCHCICRDRLALVSSFLQTKGVFVVLWYHPVASSCLGAAGSGTSFKVLDLSLPGVGHLLFMPVSILVCSVLRCSVYRRFLLTGNMPQEQVWFVSLY